MNQATQKKALSRLHADITVCCILFAIGTLIIKPLALSCLLISGAIACIGYAQRSKEMSTLAREVAVVGLAINIIIHLIAKILA